MFTKMQHYSFDIITLYMFIGFIGVVFLLRYNIIFVFFFSFSLEVTIPADSIDKLKYLIMSPIISVSDSIGQDNNPTK